MSIRIYKNAVYVLLSSEHVQKIFKCDKVLFGITGKNDLADISVIELSENEITYVMEELKSDV